MLNLWRQGKNIDEQVDATLDRLLVEFGKEILKIVPGKVSTEVDASFSFDIEKSLGKARHIIDVCYQPLTNSRIADNMPALQRCRH